MYAILLKTIFCPQPLQHGALLGPEFEQHRNVGIVALDLGRKGVDIGIAAPGIERHHADDAGSLRSLDVGGRIGCCTPVRDDPDHQEPDDDDGDRRQDARKGH